MSGMTPTSLALATRRALLPFLVYLLLSLPLALISPEEGGWGRGGWLTFHLLALGGLALGAWELGRRGGEGRPGLGSPGALASVGTHGSSDGRDPWNARDRTARSGTGAWVDRCGSFLVFLPLVLLPLLYWELPRLNQVLVDGYLDPIVLGWEGTLFPGNPARTLAERFDWLVLSELLHISYLAYYLIIYLPPCLLWVLGRRDEAAASVFFVTAAFTVCYLIFLAFPVEGPRYGGVGPQGVVEGPVRALTLTILQGGSSRGTAFPSSHVAVALTQALFLWRVVGSWGKVVLPLALLLALGAVYGGFHYAVDTLAGAGMAILLHLSLEPSERRKPPGGTGVTPRGESI